MQPHTTLTPTLYTVPMLHTVPALRTVPALQIATFAMCAMTLFACNDKAAANPEGTAAAAADPAAAAADPAAAAAAAAAAPAAAGDGTVADCEAYTTSLCEVAGAETGTCESIKSVIKLLPPRACKAGMTDIAYSKELIAAATKQCDELMERLCKDLGEETESCKMVRTKTPSFGAERCAKMLGDYPQVLAQLKQMENANKPIAPETFAAVTAPGAGEFGPADSKVTIVEFSDFQCPYCVRAATATKALKAKYGSKIRLIFRQYPLDFHKNAHLAAQAALEGLAQGKFWEMHDAMFENQKALERADLEKYAEAAGLDMKKFKAALDNGTHKAAVDADMKLGGTVGVQGTPTMFLNGAKVADASNPDAIGAQIDALLAQP